MSFDMQRLVVRARGISPSAKLVLMILADHHNGQTGACFPSYETLRKETGLSRRTVIRARQELSEKGLVPILERGGGRRSNRYDINATSVMSHIENSRNR